MEGIPQLYGLHTTGSDAPWAGVPGDLPGRDFASRVAEEPQEVGVGGGGGGGGVSP